MKKCFNILVLFLSSLICFNLSRAYSNRDGANRDNVVARTITVDKWGHGNFRSVQEAIDSIPPNNKWWIRIHVAPGVYNEKVRIPKEKPFIVLEGENRRTTIIQWNDHGNAITSCTFALFAENFVARNISFKNSYDQISPRVHGKVVTWAPAALIQADKASFYYCAFISLQDTLTDSQGRHYFKSCYIEGAIDFIWGNGRSVYQACAINSVARALNGITGYVTAQGRNSSAEDTGFIFQRCVVYGTGSTYLGRAYGGYSRVIFYKTALSNNVVPEGWSAWGYTGHEQNIAFSEEACTGAGSDKSKRVKWEKHLNHGELHRFAKGYTFIDQEGWINKQPQLL
uniref:pectinesterase n=1 Tax=Nelumbo nucifera TaxID=4432 RepID=A0A822Z0M2_NELNU|nr:TPA_asm: hypothetical protein HUJ06_008931 [Nelumbo nucifera]